MRARVRRLEGVSAGAADVFELLKGSGRAAFLDSSLSGGLGRFSIVGIDPRAVLTDEGGVVKVNGRQVEGGFLETARGIFGQRRDQAPGGLPLASGAIGYLSYDYGRRFERIGSHHPKELRMPDAQLVFYRNYLIEDHVNGTLFLTDDGLDDASGRRLDQLERLARSAPKAPVPVRTDRLAAFQSRFTREEYEAAVAAMIQYMGAGDIYVANMTHELIAPSQAAPYDVYRYLRTYNPAPFSAYLEGEGWAVCCASMERFLRLRDGVVQTRPIKGTRPRGATPEEDRANLAELRGSVKDHSELLMIVDLERNDLSRVCVPGSVQVTDHFAIEPYATVFHLVSTIEGRLADDKDVFDLVRAAFPGGSITGAPKIRAMQIIDELERSARGMYTGSIGYFSDSGDCDLNIVIRTAIWQDGCYRIGAGGGITYESDPAFEYQETLDKARAVLAAVAGGEAR